MESELKEFVPFISEGLKAISEVFLKPKLEEIKKKWKSSKNDYTSINDTQIKLEEFLTRQYKKCVCVNLIALKRKEVLLNDIYIPLTIYNKDQEYVVKKDINQLFFKNNCVLITDNAGMGKSTIIRKLITSMTESGEGIPLLIELRRLSSHKSILEEILNHLNEINKDFDKKILLDLIRSGGFTFFFDGFDEISLIERSHVTNNLLEFINKSSNNRFVITSRPEGVLTSFGNFSEYKILGLTADQAFELLEKYDSKGITSKTLIEKLNDSEIFSNISEYLTTPLLVSLLFTAFEYKQHIPFKKHIFYRQVYDALYENHDLSKGDSFIREKKSNLSIDDFHRFLRCFGFVCLQKGNKIEFEKDELLRALDEAIVISKNLDVNLSDFISDINTAVPVMHQDGIYYRWNHKSLQEYFASQYLYHDSRENLEKILTHVAFHKDNFSFENVLDLYKSVDKIGFEEIILFRFLIDLQNYANKLKELFPKKNIDNRAFRGLTTELVIIKTEVFSLKGRVRKDNLRQTVLSEMHQTSDKIQEISISILDDKTLKKHGYLVVPNLYNNYFLVSKLVSEYKIFNIKRLRKAANINIEDLDVEKNKLIKFSDDPKSVFNNEENFDKITQLISLYFRNEIVSIDYNEIDRLIKKIQQDKSLKSIDLLLNF